MPISMRVEPDYPKAVCFNCGATVSTWRTRRGLQFVDKDYCGPCVKELCRRTAHNMLEPKERFLRLLNRASRHKLVAPAQMYDLLNRFRVAIRYQKRTELCPPYSECGWFAGRSLAWNETTKANDNYVAARLRTFWDDLSKKKASATQVDVDLAVLLTILGDKHAIRHTTKRSRS